MYQLQSELDKEEVTARYIKLDMNNIQVELNETKDEFKVCKKELKFALKVCKKELKNSLIENWTMRGLVLLYIIFHIYSVITEVLFKFDNNDHRLV
jgi:hypothetical protein